MSAAASGVLHSAREHEFMRADRVLILVWSLHFAFAYMQPSRHWMVGLKLDLNSSAWSFCKQGAILGISFGTSLAPRCSVTRT